MAKLTQEERRRLDERFGSPPEYKLPAWAYVVVLPLKDDDGQAE